MPRFSRNIKIIRKKSQKMNNSPVIAPDRRFLSANVRAFYKARFVRL
jgi:hypothetical protein